MNNQVHSVPLFSLQGDRVVQVSTHNLFRACSVAYRVRNHSTSIVEVDVMKSVRILNTAGVAWMYCGPCSGKTFLLKRYPRAFIDTDNLLRGHFPLLRRAVQKRSPVSKRVTGVHHQGDPDDSWLTHPCTDLRIEMEEFIRIALRRAYDKIVLSNLPIGAIQIAACTGRAISALPCIRVVGATDLLCRWSSRAIFADAPTLSAVSKFIADEAEWVRQTQGIDISLTNGAYLADFLSQLVPEVLNAQNQRLTQ